MKNLILGMFLFLFCAVCYGQDDHNIHINVVKPGLVVAVNHGFLVAIDDETETGSGTGFRVGANWNNSTELGIMYQTQHFGPETETIASLYVGKNFYPGNRVSMPFYVAGGVQSTNDGVAVETGGILQVITGAEVWGTEHFSFQALINLGLSGFDSDLEFGLGLSAGLVFRI